MVLTSAPQPKQRQLDSSSVAGWASPAFRENEFYESVLNSAPLILQCCFEAEQRKHRQACVVTCSRRSVPGWRCWLVSVDTDLRESLAIESKKHVNYSVSFRRAPMLLQKPMAKA